MATSSLLIPSPRAVVTTEPLRAFIEEHYDRLWRVLRRLGVPSDTVEDAAQEVLLILARRGQAVERGAEWAFAFGTARRVAADIRRKEASRPRHEGNEDVVDPRGDHGSRTDDLRLLDRLLDTISDEQREVLVLVELEGMTMAEVAALLEVPPGTVASRLRRAREHLALAVRDLRARSSEQG